MRYAHKFFHEKNFSEYNKIHQKRFHFDSAMRTGLTIKPMSQSTTFELYYVPTNKMLQLVNDVHAISEKFNAFYNELPTVAQVQFVDDCLQEELYHTNDLEGIKSTKQEIAESVKQVKRANRAGYRFESMIKSYMEILKDDFNLPTEPEDIRKIYDDITRGEILEDNFPDGEIFRQENTNVLKQSGSEKVIHQGVMPESQVIESVHQLLEFMNKNNEIPLIIKVIIGHYFFGYIHPFYDGNGRTSRFISSMYLAGVLGNYSSLSLSRGCNKRNKDYLKAFEITNSIKSSGELNFFIETMLEILKNSLEEMFAEIKEKYQLMQQAFIKIKQESKLERFPEVYRDLMFIFAQDYFFDITPGLTIKELAAVLNKSEATIRKMIKFLLEEQLIEQHGMRPAYYSIQKSFLEEDS